MKTRECPHSYKYKSIVIFNKLMLVAYFLEEGMCYPAILLRSWVQNESLKLKELFSLQRRSKVWSF